MQYASQHLRLELSNHHSSKWRRLGSPRNAVAEFFVQALFGIHFADGSLHRGTDIHLRTVRSRRLREVCDCDVDGQRLASGPRWQIDISGTFASTVHAYLLPWIEPCYLGGFILSEHPCREQAEGFVVSAVSMTCLLMGVLIGRGAALDERVTGLAPPSEFDLGRS